jgi:hypothetical protein
MGILLGSAVLHGQTTDSERDKGAAAQSQTPTFSGTLLDAECKADNPGATCPILPVSKFFGVQTPAGRFLKLDSKGNARVLVALRRVRRKTGDLERAGIIKASVTGTLDGDTIKVDALELY